MSELIVVYMFNVLFMVSFTITVRSVSKKGTEIGGFFGCFLFACLFAIMNTAFNYTNLVEFAPPFIKYVSETSNTVVEAVLNASVTVWEFIMP